MGGKVTIIGGVDTTNLHDEIPETPVENLNAVTEASREYGSFY